MTEPVPKLVVVCGLPGVGKTTVAERVTAAVDASLVRTDVVRKELVEVPTYDEVEDRRTYDAVLGRARDRLDARRNVVVDGTFRRAADRVRAQAVARETGAEFSLLRVTCDQAVVAERLAERTDDASDANFIVHRVFREAWEPVELSHATVDNTGDLERTRRQVDRVLVASARAAPTSSTE